MFGVCANVVASTVPLDNDNGDDVAAGVPVHVELANHLKVTFPVGVARLPVTVALSCTLVPLRTAMMCSCDALWTSVPTVGSILLAVNSSQGPTLELYVVSPP